MSAPRYFAVWRGRSGLFWPGTGFPTREAAEAEAARLRAGFPAGAWVRVIEATDPDHARQQAQAAFGNEPR